LSKEPAAFFTDKKEGLLFPSSSLSDPACSSIFSDVSLNLTGRKEISIRKRILPNQADLKLFCIYYKPFVKEFVDAFNVSVKKPAKAKSFFLKNI